MYFGNLKGKGVPIIGQNSSAVRNSLKVNYMNCLTKGKQKIKK